MAGLARAGVFFEPADRLAVERAALLRCEEQLATDPLHPQANFLLGALAEETGNLELARHFWHAAAQCGDDALRAEAGSAIDSATARTARASDPLVRGAFAFFQSRLDDACEAFRESARDGNDSGALYLARAMIAAGRPGSEVIALLRGSLAGARGSRAAELQAELACALARDGAGIVVEVASQDESAADRELIDEIRHAREANLAARPLKYDRYQDSAHLDREWHRSRNSLALKTPHETFVSYYHSVFRRELPALLARLNATQLVDFGVLCAHTDHELAGLLPHVQFLGVDRSEMLLELNRAHYARPNLRFYAGDIFEALGALEHPREGVLFHMKTGELLYPQAVRALYRRCAALGIRAVVAIEDWGFSRETGRFGTGPHESVAYHGIGFMHDYPAYMRAAGYTTDGSTIEPIPLLWKHVLMLDTHVQHTVGVLAPA